MRMQESSSAAGAAFMEQSMWATFLNGSVFSPVPARDALRSLLTQTNELAGVMNSFKERYVSTGSDVRSCKTFVKISFGSFVYSLGSKAATVTDYQLREYLRSCQQKLLHDRMTHPVESNYLIASIKYGEA